MDGERKGLLSGRGDGMVVAHLALSASPRSCPSLMRTERCIRCIFGLSIIVTSAAWQQIRKEPSVSNPTYYMAGEMDQN